MPSLIETLSLDCSNEIEIKFNYREEEEGEEEEREEKTQTKDDVFLHKYTPSEHVSMIADFTPDDFNFLYKFSQSLNKKSFTRREAEQILSNAIENKLIDSPDVDLILNIDKNSEEYTALKIINLITCINYFRCGRLNELIKCTKGTIYENILDFLFTDMYKKEKPSMEILIYISYLNPFYLSLSFLIEFTKYDDDRLFKGLSYLRKINFLETIDSNGATAFRMESVVQTEVKKFLRKFLNETTYELIYRNLLHKFDNFFSQSLISVIKPEFAQHSIAFIENFKEYDSKSKEYLKIETDILFEIADYCQNNELNYHKALEYKIDALNLKYKIYDENDTNIGNSFNNIGASYLYLGEYKLSMEHYTKALNIYYHNYNANLSKISNTYNNIGISLMMLCDYENSIAHLDKSLQIKEKLFDKYHSSIASTLGNIGTCYQHLAKYETAIKYLNATFDIQFKLYGMNHVDVANTLNNIGINHQYLDEYRVSILYFNNSLDIYSQFFTQNHPNIASVLNNIGLSYQYMKSFETSIEYFKKALEMKMKIFDTKSHTNLADTYFNLGMSYQFIEDYAKSLENLNKALGIYKKVYKGHEKPLVDTLWNIEVAKKKLDKRDFYIV